MSVKVKVGMDTSAYSNGIRTMKRQMNQFGSGISKYKSMLSTLGVGLAGSLSAVGIVTYTKSLIDSADAMGKLSARTGFTIKEVQQFSLATKLIGQDVGSAERAIKKLQQGLGNPQPSAVFVKSLHKIGLSMEELKGMKSGEQFKAIMTQISKLPSHTERAGVALQLFGRAGTELLPMLEGGAEGFDKLINKASEMGMVMSDKTIKAAENFNDQITVMSTNIQAMVASSGIIEWLNNIASSITEIQDASRKIEKEKIKGNYSEGGYSTARFALDYLTLGYGSGVENIKGSSEMISIDTQMTDEYQKYKRARDKKNAKEKNDIVQARKDKKELEKQQALKALEDRKKLVEKEANEQADKKKKAEADKLKEKKLKDQAKFTDALTGMKQRLEIQNLINNKLEKEASIKQKIYDMEKSMGRKLTDQEKASITTAQGSLFDAQNKKEKKTDLSPASRYGDIGSNISHAGLIFGGVARSLSDSMDRQRNNLLKQIADFTKVSANRKVDIGEMVLS